MIEISRSGTRASFRAPASRFSGTVWQDQIVKMPKPGLLSSNVVTFEPGARTAWHTHPMGQALFVTAGQGLIQRWGAAAEVINPGDSIWIPPGVKHWHGATSTVAMTHISMQESEDGQVADWLELVSEADYAAAQAPQG